MEIDFSKNTLDCLRRVAWEVKQEEQTQEVKVPDAMPDIGTVLGAWGQPVIRGKTWHGSSMSVSGGVMAWVLYAPEDGTMPRVVETWIPYQIRWDFPQTQRDGTMLVRTLLQNMDARSVSPRKLMVRMVVSTLGEALEPVKLDVFTPGQLPEELCILRKSYPVTLPREAGEKAFTLEEELQLPPDCADAQKLIHYSLQPEITEQKIMADKVVFRGSAKLRGLCRCADYSLRPFSLEIPFSQYGELERQYADAARANIWPQVSNAELELTEDGRLQLRAGIVGQYVILDTPILEVTEDAYCPGREVKISLEMLEVPAVLEQRTDMLRAEQTVPQDGESIQDVRLCMEHPRQVRTPDGVALQQTAGFQLLYTDMEGALKNAEVRWEGQLELPTAEETQLLTEAVWAGSAAAAAAPGELRMGADLSIQTTAVSMQKIPMITGLELGDAVMPDPGRPSLILRKAGGDSLWQIAKQYGTSVDTIKMANSLEQEPDAEKLLLIPVS